VSQIRTKQFIYTGTKQWIKMATYCFFFWPSLLDALRVDSFDQRLKCLAGVIVKVVQLQMWSKSGRDMFTLTVIGKEKRETTDNSAFFSDYYEWREESMNMTCSLRQGIHFAALWITLCKPGHRQRPLQKKTLFLYKIHGSRVYALW